MRLAHNRFFENGKKLILSASLAIPLIACYPSEIHALPQRPPAVERIRENPQETARTDRRYASGKVECSTTGRSFEYRSADGKKKRIDNLLEPKEAATDLICNERNAYVLTDSSLIMVPGQEKSESSDGATLGLSFVRIDMRELLKKGLVAWAASQDRCFFLTSDNEIKGIPVEGDSVIYDLPYDMKSSRMIFHSGFLFISPAKADGVDYLVAMRFAGNATFKGIGPVPSESSVFMVRDGKLFLGKSEIKIGGQKLADIKIENKK